MASNTEHGKAPSSLTPAATPRGKDHHTSEWSSGARGGGKVPEDFAWRTNPKQWQEELGTGASRRQNPAP